MSEIETLKKALGLELENNGLDWAKFKVAHGLQPQDAKTEAADRAWFTWQHFRGEHRPNSCLLDDEGRVIGLIVKGTSLRELKLPSLPALSYLCICENKDLGKVEFAGEYPVLQHIDLGGNGLVELDLRIELPRLVYLNVSKNQIARLELAASLPALQELDASGNQLKNVVLPGKLSALRYLFLDGNGMESLETASSFSELRTLHLKDNQLRTLPKGDFRLLETLYVEGNPLESFDEVLIKGDQSGNAVEIIAQLRSIAISGEQPNYRAKLVIVGNGRVGKTCLIKRLRGQSFDSKEKYTHGVVISEMNERDFPGVKTDKLYLKVWDFGGQEVFYATHQFFMSEEALYIYAWTDKAIAEQNRQNDEVQSPKHRWRGHAYWLDNVRMHSKNSPLLVVRTHEGEAEELFPPDLKDKYQEGPYLNFDASIEDAFFVNRVKNAVTEALNKLPILGTSFPKNYYDLIETLSGYRQKGIAEISRAEFDTLATQYKIPEKDQDAALSYLHKTGEVIYFDSEGLKEKVYINPVALTERLYKLIEGNDFLEKHLGKFDTAYAEKVFDSTDWRELLGLLEHFALIFRKPVKEGIYIAPQYLPDLADTNENEQNMFKGHKRNRKLRFTLYYPHILPENVMVNLLCVFGPYAIDAVYRNAIYFERENDTEGCVILADEENRQIEVYTDEDPGGDSLAKSVFEKFKELSKKAEIHIAVEKGKWIKANLLEDKTRETYPTADGNDSVKAGEFRFLVGDRGEIEIKIEDMTPEEIKKIVQGHRGINTNPSIGPQKIEVAMATDAKAKIPFEKVKKSVKLFFTAATPMGHGQLNTGLESRFEDLIKQYDEHRKIKFEQAHGLKREDFRLQLANYKPHILHFGGHGEADALVLQDEPITTDILVRLARLLDDLQLVVLNACNTLPIAKELAKYVPYVIGTQGPLKDDAAIAFARGFYGTIAGGNSVEYSFNSGLIAVAEVNPDMEGIPVLLTRKENK